MENNNDLEGKLNTFQSRVDQEYKEFAKNDFNVKLEYFNSLKPILKERDDFIQDLPSSDEGANFWEKAAQNCPSFRDLLPLEEEDFSISWIESLRCWYEENYVCGVEIALSRNDYLNNRRLTKKFSLLDHTSEGTELKVKKEAECLLFDFFRENDYDLEVFDILYELYINGAYYYCMCDESDSTENK